MFLYLFLLIAGLSYAEIFVLIKVGAQLGAFTAIALTILTAFVGASLVRSQGLQTALSARASLERGEAPAQQMIEGMMLVLAGVFLVIPGFITDFVGMMLLVPPLREYAARRFIEKQVIKVRQHQGYQGGNTYDHQGPTESNGQYTLEGEFEKKDEPEEKK